VHVLCGKEHEWGELAQSHQKKTKIELKPTI